MQSAGSLPVFTELTARSVLPVGLALHPPVKPLDLPRVDVALTAAPASVEPKAPLRAGLAVGASGLRATTYTPLTLPAVDWAFSAAVPDPPAARLREQPAGTARAVDKTQVSIAAVVLVVVDRFGPYGRETV